MTLQLSQLFMGHLCDSIREGAAGDPDLERVLGEAWERVTAAWPGLALAPEDYFPFLAERIPDGSRLPEVLDEIHVEDLFLTCALARTDEAALGAYRTHYQAQVEAQVRSMRVDGARLDDIVQSIHHKLFVVEGDRPPKIAQYTGRGALHRWLRVVATRETLNELRKTRRERPAEDGDLISLVMCGEDPELGYLKSAYRAEFKVAFEAILAALEDKERNVMRYYLIDGLNINQIGSLYRVHRATVARWIAGIRVKLLEGTRAELMTRLRLEDAEVDSIMRLICSQLDASIERLLAS